MKTITAAFDGLKFSSATVDYATWVANKNKAFLTGVFLEDFTYHGYRLFDMVGSRGVSAEKIQELMTIDKRLREKAVAGFEAACERDALDHSIHRDKHIAFKAVLQETIYADLMVIGSDETFSHFDEPRPTLFIRNLLSATHCPVLLVPSTFREIERVVILYDGKPPAVFAAKMFNYLLPFLKKCVTEVVTVSSSATDRQTGDDELFHEFIKKHFPGGEYITLYGEPEKELPAYLKTMSRNTLVVLGAYNRGELSMWFRKSMADVLLEELNLPLFIAHNK